MFCLKQVREFLSFLGVSDDDIAVDFFCIEEMDGLSADIHEEVRKIHPIADRITSKIDHLQSREKWCLLDGYVFEMQQEIGIQSFTFSYNFSFGLRAVFEDVHDIFGCALLVIVSYLIEGDSSFRISINGMQFRSSAKMSGEVRPVG